MFYALNVFAVDVGVSLATIIRDFKPGSATRHELTCVGSQLGLGLERKSLNYLVAECRKSEKGNRLNYENTYG